MVPFIHQDSTSSCADFRIDSTPLLRCVSIVCTTCIEQRELGVDCKQFYFPYQVIGVATHQWVSNTFSSLMVFIQDIDGKTPLTLTCDAACELFKGDQNSYDREPPSFQVVEVPLKASVSSVRYELPFAIIKYNQWRMRLSLPFVQMLAVMCCFILGLVPLVWELSWRGC